MSHVRTTKGPDRTHKVTVMFSDKEYDEFRTLMRHYNAESVADGLRKAVAVAFDQAKGAQ